MTTAEFKALTGKAFPMKLDDLPAVLDKLAKAGYTARVVGEPGKLALAIEKQEDPCLKTHSDF